MFLFPRRNSISREGNSRDVNKGSYSCGSSRQNIRGVCQQHLFSPQKRQWLEACNKFKESKPVSEARALQDGRDSYASRPSKKRRFHGETRFEGCILHSTYMGETSEISPILLEGEPFRVCLPPLRPCLSSKSLYEDHEASSGSVMTVGDPGNCLSRRPVDHGRIL